MLDKNNKNELEKIEELRNKVQVFYPIYLNNTDFMEYLHDNVFASWDCMTSCEGLYLDDDHAAIDRHQAMQYLMNDFIELKAKSWNDYTIIKYTQTLKAINNYFKQFN